MLVFNAKSIFVKKKIYIYISYFEFLDSQDCIVIKTNHGMKANRGDASNLQLY